MSEQANEIQTEAGQESGVLASLGIKPVLLTFQLLNFVVVAAIIWFLILKPLLKKMKERQSLIDESLEKAKKIEETFAALEIETKMRLEKTQRQAKQIIAEAKTEARSQAETEKEKGKQEIKTLFAEAQEKIAKDKAEMFSDLKKEVGALVLLACEKILGEKANTQEDKKNAERILKEMEPHG